MKKVLVVAGIVAAAFLAFRGCFGGWTTSWNQRLTLVIETPQGEVRGSAVTRVSFSPRNKIILRDLDSSTLRLKGEAAMVEVFPGRWLFAILPDQESLIYNYVKDREPGSHLGFEKAIPLILDQTEPLKLDPKAESRLDFAPRFPILITFDDIARPEAVRQVDPGNLEAVYGEGVRLKAVTIEVTRDAVTEGEVQRVLPWLEAVGRERGTLIPNPPRLSTDLVNPTIQLLGSDAFSTELFK